MNPKPEKYRHSAPSSDLQKSEGRFRDLVESSHDWVWEVDAEEVYTYAGPQCREILGYEPQEIIGRTPFDLMPPQEAQRVRLAFSEIAGKRRPFRALENVNLHKDGRLVVLETNGVPIFDAEGNYCGYRGMDRDVTERRQIENALRASEELNRATFEQAGVGIAHVGTDGRLLRVNDKFCAIVGYSRVELTQLTFQDITYPEDLEQYLSYMRQALSGEINTYSMEKRYVRKDGSVGWGKLTVVRSRTATGEPGHFISVVEDITERKRAERALEEYEKAVENADDVMFVLDREYRHVLANRALLEKTGLKREQLIGHTVSEVVGEKFFQQVAKPHIDECFAGGTVQFESEFNPPGKGVSSFLVSFYPIHGSQGIDRVCGVMHDITERKRAEEALRESKQHLCSIYNTVEDVVFHLAVEHEGQFRFVSVNAAFLRVTGLSLEKVVGKTVNEVIPEPSLTMVLENYRKAAEENTIVRWEETSDYPTGRLTGEVSVAPVSDNKGTCTHLVGSVHDITERKRAEEETRESRNKYQALIETTSDFIWEMDARGRYTYCSPQIETLWGLKPAAMIGRTPFDLVPAEQRAIAEESFAALVKTAQPFSQVELTSCDASGNLIYIESSGAPFFDHNGKLLGFRGITRDITDRKKAEAEITDRLRFETLMAELSSSFLDVTAEQIDDEINHALRRVCESLDLEMGTLWRRSATVPGHITLTHSYGPAGVPPDLIPLNGEELFPWCYRKVMAGEVLAVSSLEELPPEADRDRESWRQFGAKSTLTFGLAVGGSSIVGALSFNSVQAERAWPETLVKHLEVVAEIFSNALARQNADRSLRESEDRFRGLVQNATVGIYRTTPDGRILAANPTLIRMLGYADFASLAARNLEQEGFGPTYPRKEFRERIEREGQVIGLEAAWHKLDGSVIFVRESARTIRGEDGKILYYDGIVEDISERKRAEQALQERNRYIDTVLESAPIGFAVHTISDGVGRFVSTRFEEIYGVSRGAIDSHNTFFDKVWPYDPVFREQIRSRVVADMQSGDPARMRWENVPVQMASGETRYISAMNIPVPEQDLMVSTVWNVTENVRGEEALWRRAAFDKLMTGILSRFATCAPLEVDAAVVQALEAIAGFIGADHAFIIHSSVDRTSWGITHEWCGPKVTPRMHEVQGVPMGTLPRNEQRILAGDIVRINAPGEYPLEAGAERSNQNAEGHLSDLSIPIKTKEGIYKCIGLHSHARPVIWSNDDVVQLRLVGDAVANALERKQAFAELQKSEEKFSTAFHASPAPMTIISLATGRYLNVNRAFEERTGFRAQEIIGRTPEDFGKPSAGKELLRGLEAQYLTKSGEVRTVLLFSELIEFGGEVCSLRVEEDITERNRTEQSLREIGARLLMAQEAERQRVARELHDDFSQRLALLSIELERLAQRRLAWKVGWRARVQTMLSQIQELSTDIHSLSHQLHPSRLEDLGLVAASRSYCREVSRKTGVDVKFSAGEVPRDMSKEISLCIYRIVQEALGNVVKHSGAKTAVVKLGGGASAVQLEVSDRGKGFAMEDAQAGEGLGLVSMQERVRYVGGTCSIDAHPSGGTRVLVRIPFFPQPAAVAVRQTSGAAGSPEALSEPGTRVRVLLADDHLLLVEAFKNLLEPEFEVVGTAADGRAALAAVEELKPDLVVLDIGMPLLNGLDAARQIHILAPKIKVIFLTMNSDPEVAKEAMRIGASGYLLKTSAASELRRAIREAVRGAKYVTPSMQGQGKLFADVW